MNSTNIFGYWRIKSDLDPDEVEILHVGEDGRMVHEVVLSTDPVRRVPMRVWYSHISEDDFEIRNTPGGNSWTIAFYSYPERLVIERGVGSQFEFERIDRDSVPEAFLDLLLKSHRRMDEDEEKAAAEDLKPE